eukprot:g9058.t1
MHARKPSTTHIDSLNQVHPTPRRTNLWSRPSMSSSEASSDEEPTEHDNNSLKLYNAAHDGNLQECVDAIQAGASSDYQRHNGYTALHISAQEGHADIVKFLITKCRCQLDIQTNDHDTALLRAVRKGHTDVVQFLVENGASMSIKKKGGDSVLHVAVSWNHLHIAKILVENGAHLDVQNAHGDTPLHTAVEEGRRDMVELLINRGANMDLPTFEGETPLHYAAYEGKFAIAKLLLEKGSNYTLKSSSGKTPLDEALEQNNQMMIQVLEDATAISFNAIKLWKTEAKTLEKRVLQMQTDHERALRIASNARERDLEKFKSTTKAKFKLERAKLVQAHKDELAGVQETSAEKLENCDAIIKHLKLEMQEAREAHLEEKKTWNIKFAEMKQQEVEAINREQYRLNEEFKKFKLTTKEEAEQKIVKVESNAQEEISRTNILVKALQEQNQTLLSKLNSAGDMLAKQVEKTRAEAESKFKKYEVEIQRLKKENIAMENRLDKIIAEHNEDRANWSTQKHFELDRVMREEERKREKEVYEVVQEKMRKIEELKAEFEHKLKTQNIRLQEEARSSKHIIAKNFFRNLLHKNLNKAWQIWIHRCFIAWKEKSAIRCYARHFFSSIFHRVKERKMRYVLDSFRHNMAHVNRRNSIIKHIFGKGNDHMLRRGWNSFVMWVKVSRQLQFIKEKDDELHQYKLKIASQTIRRLAMKKLYWALMSWKKACVDMRRIENAKIRILRRWNLRIESSCFHTWRTNASSMREERNKLKQVVRRLQRIAVFRSWMQWIDHVQKRKRARLTLDRLFNKEDHEGYIIRLQKFWIKWERATIQSKFLDIEEARAKGNIGYRKHLLKRTCFIIRKKIVSTTFLFWKSSHLEALKNERLMKQVAMRIKHIVAHQSFSSWKAFTKQSKHEKHIILTVKNRMENHAVHKAYSQWRDFVQRRRHIRLVFINKAHSWRETNLQKGFHAIYHFGVVEAGQLEAMKVRSEYFKMRQKSTRATLLKLMRAKLSVAFIFWRKEVKWIKRIETAKLRIIKRMQSIALASAYNAWLYNVNERRKNKTILRRVVARIKEIKLSKTFTTWGQFVSKRRKVRDTLRFVFGGKSREYVRRMLAHGFLRFQQNLASKRVEECYHDEKKGEARLIRSILSRMNSRKLGNSWRKWKVVIDIMRKDENTHLHHRRIVRNIINQFKSKSIWRAFRIWTTKTFDLQKKAYQRINSHRLAKKIREATMELNDFRARHSDIVAQQKLEISSLQQELEESRRLKGDFTSLQHLGKLLLKCSHDTLYTHADIAKCVLDLGAPANFANDYGNTALHLAAGSGHMDLVRVLCCYGADPSVCDNNGSTPIDKAKRHNNLKVAEYLEAHKVQHKNVTHMPVLSVQKCKIDEYNFREYHETKRSSIKKKLSNR